MRLMNIGHYLDFDIVMRNVLCTFAVLTYCNAASANPKECKRQLSGVDYMRQSSQSGLPLEHNCLELDVENAIVIGQSNRTCKVTLRVENIEDLDSSWSIVRVTGKGGARISQSPNKKVFSIQIQPAASYRLDSIEIRKPSCK